MSPLVHFGAPVVLWILLYLAESRGVRALQRSAEASFKRARLRRLEAMEEEQILVHGRVVAPEGGSVDLGTSVEAPEKIRGNPTLDGKSFIVEAKDGRRFRIRPAQIRIESLPGAERKLVRTITTESGVEQTYSFEVPDGFELMVAGRLPGTSRGAFREGPIDLEPLEDGFQVGDELVDPNHEPQLKKIETGRPMSWFGGLLVVAGAGLGYIPYLGPALWWIAMVLLGLVLLLEYYTVAPVEPITAEEEAQLAQLQVRVADLHEHEHEHELEPEREEELA